MSKLFLPLREHLLNFGLMSPECFNELLVKFNVGHTACAKAALSKGLGVGIIAGSALVKVPQLLKILSAQSAEGLSLVGCLLELIAVTATGAYSYNQVLRAGLSASCRFIKSCLALFSHNYTLRHSNQYLNSGVAILFP